MNFHWLSEVDRSIEQNREHIETAASLERLMQSRDFKKVISDGYLSRLAVELVHLKGHPNFKLPEQQADIQAQIDAIGHFNQYLNTIRLNAEIARKGLAADEQTRENLLSQEH